MGGTTVTGTEPASAILKRGGMRRRLDPGSLAISAGCGAPSRVDPREIFENPRQGVRN